MATCSISYLLTTFTRQAFLSAAQKSPVACFAHCGYCSSYKKTPKAEANVAMLWMQLDRSICSTALREGVMQARRARRHLQDFAALPTTCPNCPDHPEMPLAASFFSWKLQKLSTALR